MKTTVVSIVACVLATIALSCRGGDNEKKQNAGNGTAKVQAVAQLNPTKGNQAKGTVTFTQDGDKVRVVADVEGLKPNSEHGFHIHEGAECGDDGMLAKGHWNPDNNPHAGPGATKHHAGDLGNIKADANGKGHLELTLEGVSVNGAKSPVVGHSVVLHADPDDYKTQPTGNSGARIACGPIKLAGK